MPLVDVVDLLSDPDVAGEDFQVLRTTRTLINGRTVDTPSQLSAYGSIAPASGSQLLIIPEAERVGSFISVVTPFILQPLTNTTAPDQVIWNGGTYRVRTVKNWENFGQGFCEATCELVSMTLSGP